VPPAGPRVSRGPPNVEETSGAFGRPGGSPRMREPAGGTPTLPIFRIVLDKVSGACLVLFPLMKPATNLAPSPDEHIHGHGLRMTDQRRAVYDALMGKRDHPTAVEVFMRVKTRMPTISLATVYNCLETL